MRYELINIMATEKPHANIIDSFLSLSHVKRIFPTITI